MLLSQAVRRRVGITFACVASLLAIPTLVLASPAEANHRDNLLAPPGFCDGGDVTAQLLCYHQVARTNFSVNQSHPDSRLAFTAQDKVNIIDFCKDFSHTACGWPWYHSISKASPSGLYGENLGWTNLAAAEAGGGFGRAFTSAWLHSDAHVVNVLESRAQYVGFGARLVADWPTPGPNVVVAMHFAEKL